MTFNTLDVAYTLNSHTVTAPTRSDTMTHMPGRTRPSNQPKEITDVVEALANAIRTELLHLLAGRQLTVTQLADAVGIPTVSTWRNLKALEELGWVHSHEEPGYRGRGGVRVTWSVDSRAIHNAAARWAAYAAGVKD